jgi:hypothetical protein
MLYLIESNGFLKIGYTNNLDNRMAQYGVDNPQYYLLDTAIGDRADEAYLHKLLSDYSYKGEWMIYSEEIVFKWFQYKEDKGEKIRMDEYFLCSDSDGDRIQNLVDIWLNRREDIESIYMEKWNTLKKLL